MKINKYTQKWLLASLLMLIYTQISAQVTLQVRVNSGNCTTTCTDGIFGGSPDPQWRVNVDNQGWTTYPRAGLCYTNPPNTQFSVTYDCPSGYPAQMQVCFRAFEDDGTACVVSEDCSETLCQNFPVPAAGASASYNITIPNNGTNRSWGTMNFTISATGGFNLPGFANDLICNAVNLGTVASGAAVGNNTLSNYGNYCAGNAGDPQPSNWNNEQGVWFKFTTSAQPAAIINIDATNDPAGRGDQIDLQLALYQSSNGNCNGTLSLVQSEYDIPFYGEAMAVECLLPNTTYYLLIDGADNGIFGGQQGFFGLRISDDGILQAPDFICGAEHLGTVPAGGSIGTPALRRSNVCATNTNDPNPAVWSPDQSVWFSFIAPPSGNVIVETNSDQIAPFGQDAIDLQVAVYATNNNLCTGTLRLEDAGYSPLGFDEDLNVRCLNAGQRYWVLVDGSPLNVDGIFDIQIRDGGIPPAINDLICNAIALGAPAPNSTVGLNNQNNFCADNLFEPIPSNWGNDQGVWYTFVAPPSGKVEIRTQSQGVFANPIDLQIAVYDASNMACTGTLTEIKSEHEGIGVLWDEDMEVECLIPGRTYFILIDGEGSLINPGLQEGIFDIQVYADPRDPPAPNDLICNATALGNPTAAAVGTIRGAQHGSQNNFCASPTGEPRPNGFNPRQTVWYTFVAPSTGNVNIQLTSDPVLSGIDPIDLQIAVWESSNNLCTGTLREELSGDDLLYDVNVDVYCLEPGRTYFVQIDGSGPAILGGREGYFDIQVSQLPPIPVAVNNQICNAVALGSPFTNGAVSAVNQQNLCADNIGDPSPSAFSPDQTVWYTFTTPVVGTTYAVNIEATSSLPWPFGNRNSIDLQLAVYSSSNNSCTGTLTEVDSDYDLGFFDEDILVQCLLPNTTYFVMVDGSALDVQGYFDIEITPATAVPIPTNDDICQHTNLGVVPVNGSLNNGANYFNFCADTEPNEPSPFNIDQTVWFSFVAPNHLGANATANVTIRVESDPANLGNDVDLQLAVYESSNNLCTGGMRLLDDADPLFSADSEVELTCLYPNRRYWVQVDGSAFDVDGYFRIIVEDDGSGIRPTNNILCNAVALGAVPNGGSINNGVNYLNLCSDTESGEPNPSAFAIEQTVWYSFIVPASGNVTIRTRNDPNNIGDQIDLQLAVYQAANNSCAGPFIEIDSRYNPLGFDESLTLECLRPGDTYFVQVDGASGALGGQEGYFTISISDDGGTSNFPYNNDICNARNFGIPTGAQQQLSNENNECANVQFSEPGVGSYATHTVWYQFTAPSSSRVRISVQSNNIFFGIDPEIRLFASSNNTCTGTFSQIESSVLPTALITETIEATCLTAGNVYFLQVDGSGLVEQGDFTIRIVDMRPNYGTGLAGDPQPINNECINAVPLTVQAQSCFNGNGNFQQLNYGEPTISLNNNFVRNCNQNCGDTWYSFTMPQSGIAVLESDDDNIGTGFPLGDFSEATLAAYTGGCGNLTPLNCAAGGFSNDVTYEIAAPPGATVYLQIFNDAGDDDDEDFLLCVSEGCGADHCLNAVAYPILPNIPYCFNTSAATADNVSGGEAGYFECGENDNPENSVYYYFVSDCNGSAVTINVINGQSAGGCTFGTIPGDGFNISLFQDATPCDNVPDALVDCQNFNSCMPQPINWSQTYTSLIPNTPYIIQIDGGFNFLGGDNNGQIMIQTTTNPVIIPTSTPVSCGGANNGTATATVAGGTPSFTFQWSNGATDSIITNLATGTYFVTATGANGCTDTASIFVPSNNNSLAVNTNNITNESCNNQCDGTATVAGSGGVAPYRYLWDASASSQTSSTATGLCAGLYSVTVLDNSTCSQTAIITITNPSPITATLNSFANATCVGCDGTANLSASGGTIAFAYHYQWSNGSVFANATGLCAGIYTVTATDDNGCTAINSVTITQPATITATIANQTNVNCFANSNGAVQINAGNGIAPYTFNLNGTAQGSNSFTNLSAGAYNITVSDALGCRTFVPITITQPSALAASLISSIDASCNGESDGELSILATNSGTSPYQYSMDGLIFQNSGVFSNLSAGNYNVTVRDANNCSVSVPATINEPAAINLVLNNQTGAACGICDATANISATGGAGLYNFSWSNGEISNNATALCAGNNSVTVTDANGCEAILNIIINNANGFGVAANITQNISCNAVCDASASLNPTAGNAPYSFIWQNGNTNSVINGLCAGNYRATVTDANGCPFVSVVSISEPAVLALNIAQLNPVSCVGVANGQAVAVGAGGTIPYRFVWSNGETVATATALSAGLQTVTITDANSCQNSSQVSITQGAGISVSIQNITNSACASMGCTGSALANAAGGVAPYRFVWSNGNSTNNPNNLCPNFNTVTVTDANGCTATASANIPSNSNLSISNINVLDISCAGLCNGVASVSATGGNTTQPYRFSWSNGLTNANITSLCAGQYQVTVSDVNNCSAAANVTITEPSFLSITLSSTDAICAGANSGTASVIATGGNPAYTYRWDNSNVNQTANNLAAGLHTVTVTDANNCKISGSVTITQPASLSISTLITSNYNGSQISCASSNNGTATVTAVGGTGAFSYLWINGQTTANITGLQASNYPVTATDASGCRISSTISVTPPAILNISTAITSNYNGFNISCFNSNNGTATATATGGTGAYTYLWSGGQNGSNAANMSSGVYTVTVTDINGCIAMAADSLNRPSALSVTATALQNISCFAGNNGIATANASGGIAPYSYLWANGANVISANNLTFGNHNVTITDANGCPQTATVFINQPTQISINNITITNATCNGSADGKLTTTANGGSPAYSFLWSNGQTNNFITGLTAGTYNLTVTDRNNCQSISSASVGQPLPLISNAVIVNNIRCFAGNNGGIQASANGGTAPYSYLWSNGSLSAGIFGLTVGTYSVTITDFNQCRTVSTITLTQPAAFSATAAVNSNYNGQQISCFSAGDGSITVNTNGGTAPFSYFWAIGNTTQTVTGLTRGVYNVQVTDANGCVVGSGTTLSDPTPLEMLMNIQNVSCFAANTGAITANPSGGTPNYSFVWSNGQQNQTATSLLANTYSVTASDANGCTITAVATVLQPAPLHINDAGQIAENCSNANDGIGYLDGIIGGRSPYTVLWSNGQTSAIATGLSAGVYTATVTDANGCAVDTFITVLRLADLQIGFTDVNSILCDNSSNGRATVLVQNGTAPYIFVWDNGFLDSTATHLHAGNNFVTVTDFNGCAAVGSVFINAPAPLSVIKFENDISCFAANDGAAGFAVSGGTPTYSFVWSNGLTAANVTGLSPQTIYWVTITDANGCSALQSVYLRQPSEIRANIIQVENESCDATNDGLIIVQASGGRPAYNFVWSNGQTTFAALQSTMINLRAGAYSVTITDSNGCAVRLDTIITQPLPLIATFVGTRTSCFLSLDGQIRISPTGGTAPYFFYLNDSTFSRDSVFNNLAAGLYNVSIRDINDCIFAAQVRVSRPDSTLLLSSDDRSINLGDTVHLFVRMPINSPNNPRVSWSPSAGLSCDTCYQPIAQPMETTLYTVTIMGDDGCPSRSEVLITVDKKRDIFIPNAFTPNGDGVNDIFMVFGHQGVARINKMMIFDRWGELVFAVENAPINYTGFGWDGTFRGKSMNPAVFIYYVELTYLDGVKEIKKGDFTLIK
jgi:large repetitive protein